jgi:hypothetical protein
VVRENFGSPAKKGAPRLRLKSDQGRREEKIMARYKVILIALVLAVAQGAISMAQESPDPQTLVGYWEGTMKRAVGLIKYGIHVFAIEPEKKLVMFRRICPDCDGEKQVYLVAPLRNVKDKVIFGYESTTFTLDGDRLTGADGTGASIYNLRKVPPETVSKGLEAITSDSLVGKWIWGIWGRGNKWYEMNITSADLAAGTLEGDHWTGWGRTFELTDVRLFRDGERLRMDIKTMNKSLQYELTYYPGFREFPPVLWGKATRFDGTVGHAMMYKFDQKEN